MNNKAVFTICLGLLILAVVITVGCKKEPEPLPAVPNDSNQVEPSSAEATEGGRQKASASSQSDGRDLAKGGDNNSPTAAVKPVIPQIIAASKPTLNDIIRKSSTWGTAFTRWYSKDAPDFTVTDLNGKKHTLSEYKGKTVMLIFWATWCGPCIAEIPDLIKLRKQIGEDKLVMLAISYTDQRNSPERVKSFVAANRVINYPVTATNPADMPRPYNLINSIPCSFFIAPDGKIKLATEGMIPLTQAKAIIEADH
jgi:thiol-disulfide isomerase/thioredoxin